MPIQIEMVLYNELNQLHEAFEEMVGYTSIPIPYPLINIVKICIFAWIAVAPFVLGTNHKLNKVLVIFFLIYSVVGLDAVASEAADPFGDDANDLEVEKMTRVSN